MQLHKDSDSSKKQTRSSRSVGDFHCALLAITVWQEGHQSGFGLRGGDTVNKETINQLKSPYSFLGVHIKVASCVKLVLMGIKEVGEVGFEVPYLLRGAGAEVN